MFSFDLFGRAPVLTLKGDEQSKSIVGSIVSLAVYVIFFLYTYQKSVILIKNLEPNIQISETLRDMDDLTTFEPKSAGFDFAFSLKRELDPAIAYFDVKLIREFYLSNGTKLNETKNLEIQRCTNGQFQFDNKTQLTAIQLEKYYYCLNNSLNYQSVSLPILPQKPDLSSLKCGLSSVLDSVINNQKFYFVFANSNFAPQNLKEPINKFLDDSVFFEMEPGKNKKADILVKQQTVELLDDIWQIDNPIEKEFAQVDNIRFYESSTSSGDNSLITVNIKLDKAQATMSRTAYSILNFLGDIGGLQGILYLIGFYLCSSISEFRSVFKRPKISNDADAVQNLDNKKTMKPINLPRDTEKQTLKIPKPTISLQSSRKNYQTENLDQYNSNLSIGGGELNNQHEQDYDPYSEDPYKQQNQRNMFKKLRMNLNVFNYYSDVIVKAVLKRYRFTYGVDAIFGIVKIMEKLLFNKYQRNLIKYQQEWLVSSASEKEQDHQDDLLFLKERSNKKKLAFRRQIINDNLNGYQSKGNLSVIDKKLVYGLFKNDMRDFDGSNSSNDEDLKSQRSQRTSREQPQAQSTHQAHHVRQKISSIDTVIVHDSIHPLERFDLSEHDHIQNSKRSSAFGQQIIYS
ncbi:UNKNOWN [Stylonychia lemnae]|uniref:Uncharacterized protein n=1 Tax=Stylonychia lemnae TaxID=5949 RepID=A0A078AMX7_STYLE|nr:UNKNOWN [Stylonychia lemnae]|eukprot:CDW83281.1 UNKNOWN [Stylonychia lemnae]